MSEKKSVGISKNIPMELQEKFLKNKYWRNFSINPWRNPENNLKTITAEIFAGIFENFLKKL